MKANANARGKGAAATVEAYPPLPPPGVPLTVTQAGALLQLSASTMRRRSKEDPQFPQPFLIGGQQHRYDRAEILAYIDRQRAARGS